MADWDVVDQTPVSQTAAPSSDWEPVSHEPMQTQAGDWEPVSHEPIDQGNQRTWGQEIRRDVRTFARGVAPAAAAAVGTVGGAILGGAAGSAVPGPGTAIGGFVGALAGGAGAGIAAQKVQNTMADAMGIDSEEQRQADAANPNVGSLTAEFAPAVVGFSPGNLATKLSQRVLQGGIGGVVNIAQQEATKGEVDPTELGIATATGAVLANPRPYAQTAGSAVAKGIRGALGQPTTPAESGVAGNAGAANGTPATSKPTSGNENAAPPPPAAEQPHSPAATPSVAGTAVDRSPVPEVRPVVQDGTPADLTAQPDIGAQAHGSSRNLLKSSTATEGGIPGAASEPLVTLDPAAGASPDLLDTVRGQQGDTANETQTPAPPAPKPAPQAPEQSPPANEPAAQAPGPEIPEDLSIPPFLRRTPPGVEPPANKPSEGQNDVKVTQQAQQPQLEHPAGSKVFRGVPGKVTAASALTPTARGDLGKGIYVSPNEDIAKSYGGGPDASVKAGTRAVHSYTLDPALTPEETAHVLGGKKIGEEVRIVRGNGEELYKGPWGADQMETALAKHPDIRVVVGNPDSVGINQIAIRDRSAISEKPFQQAQQPQPPVPPQGHEESDAEFAARIKANQAQSAQNSPGGRQPGAPYNMAQATKAVEKLNGDTVKDKPAAAQAAVNAADEKIGRVPLRTRNAVEKWLRNTFLGKLVNPTGAGEDEAGPYFKASARSNLGEIQQRLDTFDHAFNQPMRDVLNNLTPEQGHEIQRALQDPNPMERLAKWPELEPVVRELRNQIKADADFKLQKGGLDATQIERDHFPQLWKDPKAADDFLDNWYARQGSKAGFKAKVHPTIADGEAAGLQLKYTNPIDPVKARMRSDYRYQMGNSMLQDALRDGIVSRTQRPGDIPLSARLNGIDTKLYAPEGYATPWNNHFGPGFRDSPAGKAFMDLAQPATAWSRSMLLGLSPFHGVTMLNEGWISQVKLGLQTMARDPVEGAKILAKSPIGGATIYGEGKNVQKASLAAKIDPESPYARTVPALRKANARFFGSPKDTLDFNPGENAKPLAPAPAETIMQSFSNALKEAKSDITTDFKDAKGNPIQLSKATLKSVGTAMQAISHPLFGQIIPAMKAGAAHMELGEWMRQHPEIKAGTPEEHDMAMRIWDDVENRFGMMTHDNLFINRKIKEGMQIGMTSPTWTIGFIKNFAGGLGRGVMHPSRALMGSKDYDPNISSAITLGITVALTSGIYQYLKTGKPPGSIQDLMAGQTGGKTSTGQPERAILPGFQKDVYGWFHDPINEAYNKIGPLPKSLIETATNKGWTQTSKGARYGPISNANDPFWKQVYDRGSHLAHSIEPISAQQLTKKPSAGSNISTAERAAAIREAPKYINPGGNPAERKAIDREYKQTHPGQ